MKRLILLLCLLVALEEYTDLHAQSKAELKNNFFDAESWILFEAYKDALPLYLELQDRYPENYNFKYRIGECYLNIAGTKDKAISYLEEASAHINPLYKEGKFTETGAPFDVLYYLANAYRLNNQLDKAVDAYKRFKQNLNSETYDSLIVNQQIESCRIAAELMANPVVIKKSVLGDMINSGSSVFNPVVSDKEDMIIFSRSEAFYDALLYSVRIDGEWQPPVNMNEILKVDRDIFPTSLSADGKTLYLYSSSDYDGVIYTSAWENGTWMPLVRLNDNINTRYWESHATVSHDDKKLYFTSNRKGTLGGLDIWVSERDSTGDWGPAANLGPVVNTAYNEESPFLSRDDKTLYFSSRGHYNMGGYDIFSSRLMPDGQWSEPVNEGYPLNTTDDDIFFKPAVHTGRGFYASTGDEAGGKLAIYQIDVLSGRHIRQFIVAGSSVIQGRNNSVTDTIKVTITNYNRPEQAFTGLTDPLTHIYAVPVPGGEYKVAFEGKGAGKVIRDLNLPTTYEPDSFKLPYVELPRTDYTAELSVDTSKKITVTRGDSLEIPLKVEPLSVLTIESYAGKKLTHTEKRVILSPSLRYKIAPATGDNKVVFRLTDRFNNTATSEVNIKRIKGKPEEAKAVAALPPAEKAVAEKPATEKPVAEKPVVVKQAAEKKAAARPVEEKHVAEGVSGEKKVVSKPGGKIVRPEHTGVIAKKQANAYLTIISDQAGDSLKKLIRVSGAENKKFRNPDELLQFLIKAAPKANVSREEIEKTALRVAMKDNILTKPALDLLTAGSTGELRSVLDSLGTGSAVRTWADLQLYVSEKSRQKVTSNDLNDQALVILGEKVAAKEVPVVAPQVITPEKPEGSHMFLFIIAAVFVAALLVIIYIIKKRKH